MAINLNKNAADFTDNDKWCLTNIISIMCSLEEPGRLGVKLYLDHAQMRAKYKLYKNPEIVTFKYLFDVLLNTSHNIESCFLTEPIELIHKRLENNNYMKRVEKKCIDANSDIETFIKLDKDNTHPSNSKPYD